MGERQDRRIGADDLRQREVFFHHVRVGNVGRRLSGAQREGGVLYRKEALGNDDVADHGQGQCQAEYAQHDPLVRQCLAQASLVSGEQALAEARS